jgi:hypothetical protein
VRETALAARELLLKCGRRVAPANEVNGGKNLTFAVFSCSQYQTGWFNAYGFAAQNTSADIFVHLGDYVGFTFIQALSSVLLTAPNRYTSSLETGATLVHVTSTR